MNRRRVAAAVRHADAQDQVIGIGLCQLEVDVEVPIAVEDPRVDELELGILPAARRVLRAQAVIWESGLRVAVARLQVRGGRRGVEVPVDLLDVLAMVPIGAAQAEEPLLENRIGLVPEADRQAEQTTVVTDSQESVLAPSLRARWGVLERKGRPHVAIGGVVLAHSAPLALGKVRTPLPPPTISQPRALGTRYRTRRPVMAGHPPRISEAAGSDALLLESRVDR
ncbi:MAG TPA: hypothetical protein VFM74_00005 [Candidatus Limnocylindria bacterium]|nr:hypothetical protein [Candidatus Limnocylindria bacterium]